MTNNLFSPSLPTFTPSPNHTANSTYYPGTILTNNPSSLFQSFTPLLSSVPQTSNRTLSSRVYKYSLQSGRNSLVVYNWGYSRHIWSIRTFWLKKSYMKIKKYFLNYTNSLCTMFKQNVLILKKCPDTPQLYTTDALFNKMFQYLHIVYY